MGKKSRLFASAAFPLLSLSLALQPASAVAAARGATTEAAAVRQIEQGSFEVAQDAPSEEELLKKKRKQKGEAPAEQAPAAEQPKEAPAEKPKAERKEAPAPEPKAEPEPPKAEAPKEEPAPKAESKPERKAKQAAQPEAEPQQEEQQPVTQEKPRKPKKQQTEPAEPEAQPAPEQQPAAKQAQPETEQAQPEVKPEGGKKGQDKAQSRDKSKAKTETAAPEAVTPTEEQAKPAVEPEAKPAAEAPAKKPKKGEAAAPAVKPAEDKAAAPEAAPAEAPTDGTAAKPAAKQPTAEQPTAEQPAAKQPAGEQPAAPATDTAQPLPDASGGQQVEQAIPAPEKVSPEELERRKKIAADPAKSNETVVLPVENGAAVLDSDKDADRSKGREGRRDRDKLRAESQEVKVPTSDADAQAPAAAAAPAIKLEAVTSEKGTRLDTRPQFARPEGARIEDQTDDNRVIIQYNNQVIVRSDDDRRFLRDGERPIYEELPDNRYREIITRPEGYRIVTIRNRYGDIIQRSRVDSRGREYVLYYSPDLYEDPDRGYFDDPGADLPPMRLRVPLNDYIIDTSSDPDRDYYEFLSEPPVEQVERVYSLDEVKYSARIRDKVRRIDLDTITFATGSAEIPMTQARTLRKVADAISQVLKKDPSETFLIEGHTDAVGSDQSNLVLSDQRAESVANVLSDVYGIPPENMATQGYGERYLKVNTSGPEQENRRVTIRRVTPLVRPVAANQ
ncbi:OmpA family protein [Rhizobium lentis]|uniref:OmpA family protein n=1 Tax=Rhizobium TaxID=379 RepID=UPI001612B9C5|nr:MULTISPECIES: OmpA family protein [Rhizobium]MBB3355942.1 outer membrane protein OmpA-like peptidoglycan-associated protein [Rhizobium sp. BK049]MBX5137075.1 OmpA family protein [Rhizobium lentis]MBX5143140.1 OmpA family protein [Rhizobium lentis]MBX5155120.1 OmpA family protein [Rhizobium lentis]MBX5180819.1 OmpA family protein [Rhizobium lentis]